MRIKLRAQVDVALGEAQRAEVFPDILRVGVAGDHGGHHEARIDDLPEAELLQEVVGAAEHGGGRHLAVD